MPIRAQSGLGWHRKDHDNSERISGESCELSRILDQGMYWAISRRKASRQPLLSRKVVEQYPTFLERLFSVWQGFQASLAVQGLV